MIENLADIAVSGVSPMLVYGLGFMFFTLLLASFSDLRRMTIKAEYMSLWTGLCILMFVYEYMTGSEFLLFKWGLIIILGVLSYEKGGKIFKLAKADVIAICAVCSILEIPYIIVFYIILVLVNSMGMYPLRIFGKKDRYPFMPVIWFSVLLIIIILGLVNWSSVAEILEEAKNMIL